MTGTCAGRRFCRCGNVQRVEVQGRGTVLVDEGGDSMAGSADNARVSIWYPEQYQGETNLAATATQLTDSQLASTRYSKSSAARGVLNEWIDFFAAGPTPILHLRLSSRVPQELLNSLAGQPQLESLELKWGSYSDLTALSKLTRLNRLSLGGAKKVIDFTPITKLSGLESLFIDGAFLAEDLRPLGTLTTLRELTYGSAHPGTDRNVTIPDFDWISPLVNLQRLWMPGIRLVHADVSVLAQIHSLVSIRLPLRRGYRKQVEQLASSHSAFAVLAKEYEAYDDYVARTAGSR